MRFHVVKRDGCPLWKKLGLYVLAVLAALILGGVVLLSGEPGVGKSTMLLQLCGAISNRHSVLYITGEESVRQVKLRAARLKVPQDNIFLAAENDVDEICGLIEKEKPELVVIDSIQTMRCMDISSSSGTVSSAGGASSPGGPGIVRSGPTTFSSVSLAVDSSSKRK